MTETSGARRRARPARRARRRAAPGSTRGARRDRGARRRRRRGRAAVGGRRRCSRGCVGQLASLGIARRPRAHAPGLGGAPSRGRRRRRACTRRRGAPPTTCARSARIAARAARARSWSPYADIVTQREALAGLLADPRVAHRRSSRPAAPSARPFGFATRARRGRVVSAGSPYHAVRSPTGDVPRRAQGRARRPRRRSRRSPSGSPRSSTGAAAGLAGGARPQGRAAGALASRALGAAIDAASADDAGAAARGARRRAGDVELARGRRRARAPASPRAATTSPRCCSSGSSAPASHVGVSHLRELFWARPLSPRRRSSARRADIARATTRTARCSTRRSRRTDGFFTTFFVCPYSSTSRAGRRAAG